MSFALCHFSTESNGMGIFARIFCHFILCCGEWIMFRELLAVSFVSILSSSQEFFNMNHGSSSIQHIPCDSYCEVQVRFLQEKTGTLSNDSDRFATASFG